MDGWAISILSLVKQVDELQELMAVFDISPASMLAFSCRALHRGRSTRAIVQLRKDEYEGRAGTFRALISLSRYSGT